MIYYMSNSSWFENYTGRIIYYGDIFTISELHKMKISSIDKKQLFIKIKTSQKNTYNVCGIRRIKNLKLVEEL